MVFNIHSVEHDCYGYNSKLDVDELYPRLKDYGYSDGTITVDSLEQLLELLSAVDNDIIIQKRPVDVYDPAAGYKYRIIIYDDYIE